MFHLIHLKVVWSAIVESGLLGTGVTLTSAPLVFAGAPRRRLGTFDTGSRTASDTFVSFGCLFNFVALRLFPGISPVQTDRLQ